MVTKKPKCDIVCIPTEEYERLKSIDRRTAKKTPSRSNSASRTTVAKPKDPIAQPRTPRADAIPDTGTKRTSASKTKAVYDSSTKSDSKSDTKKRTARTKTPSTDSKDTSKRRTARTKSGTLIDKKASKKGKERIVTADYRIVNDDDYSQEQRSLNRKGKTVAQIKASKTKELPAPKTKGIAPPSIKKASTTKSKTKELPAPKTKALPAPKTEKEERSLVLGIPKDRKAERKALAPPKRNNSVRRITDESSEESESETKREKKEHSSLRDVLKARKARKEERKALASAKTNENATKGTNEPKALPEPETKEIPAPKPKSLPEPEPKKLPAPEPQRPTASEPKALPAPKDDEDDGNTITLDESDYSVKDYEDCSQGKFFERMACRRRNKKLRRS